MRSLVRSKREPIQSAVRLLDAIHAKSQTTQPFSVFFKCGTSGTAKGCLALRRGYSKRGVIQGKERALRTVTLGTKRWFPSKNLTIRRNSGVQIGNQNRRMVECRNHKARSAGVEAASWTGTKIASPTAKGTSGPSFRPKSSDAVKICCLPGLITLPRATNVSAIAGRRQRTAY